MKAEEYFTRFQALSRYRLDLGAWHGFQEVLYKDPVYPEKIEFKFLLPQDTYLYVIFNKSDEGFSGIRISAHGLFSNIYFTATDDGKFTDQTPYGIDVLRTNAWNYGSVAFSTATVSLRVNGKEVGSFPFSPKAAQYIGFRGCHGPVLIDDVAIWTPYPAPPIFESFFNFRQLLHRTLLALCGLFLVNAALFWILFLRRRGLPKILIGLLKVNFAVLIASLCLFGLNLYLLDKYPNPQYVKRELEKKYPDLYKIRALEIVSGVMDRYGNEDLRAVRRVLVIGTSQTWGMGAKTEAHTMVSRLEMMLNNYRTENTSYECINGAVPSVLSGHLIQAYRETLGTLKPDILIAILSFNDSDQLDSFRQNLQELIRLCKTQSIKVCFVLEATSPEYPLARLDLAHGVMRKLARENNIVLLDAPVFLNQNLAAGILWWDIVHLTSFGQELLARFIYGKIKPLLG